MSKRPSNKRPLTKEERDMAARMRSIIAADKNITEDKIAVAVGVTQGMISHWTGGRAPVPAKRAPKLAAELGIQDPGEISLAYREVTASNGGSAPPDLVIARLENDVDTLRHAVDAIVAVMGAHRPRESADMARVIRKHVPAKFLRRGYIHELLKALDAAQVATGAPKGSVPPSAGPKHPRSKTA